MAFPRFSLKIFNTHNTPRAHTHAHTRHKHAVTHATHTHRHDTRHTTHDNARATIYGGVSSLECGFVSLCSYINNSYMCVRAGAYGCAWLRLRGLPAAMRKMGGCRWARLGRPAVMSSGWLSCGGILRCPELRMRCCMAVAGRGQRALETRHLLPGMLSKSLLMSSIPPAHREHAATLVDCHLTTRHAWVRWGLSFRVAVWRDVPPPHGPRLSSPRCVSAVLRASRLLSKKELLMGTPPGGGERATCGREARRT